MKIKDNTIFVWIAIATGVILLIPLIAMRFTAEVNWTLSDFVVMGTLIFGMSSLFVLAARKWRKHRLAIGIAFAIGFMYIWAELAVGIFTNWGS